MRLLIAATLLLTACSTAYGEEINGREAENILTKGKILHAGEGTAGSHDFTVLFSKKLYWCVMCLTSLIATRRCLTKRQINLVWLTVE